MNNYLKKVTHILPIYLLAVFLCVSILVTARYFLDFKFQILNISDKAWDIFLPMILSAFALIFIRKRFSVLKHSNPNQDNFIYIMICGVVLCATLVSSQFYYKVKLSKSQTIQNIQQISSDKNINKIKVKSYFVDDAYLSSKFTSDVSGKYGNNLNLNFYFVAPIVRDSLEEPKDYLSKVWFVNNFSKTISNRLSAEEKRIEYQNFREKCYHDLEHFNFYNNAYFLRIPNSEEKVIYERLILNVVDNPQNMRIVLLSPSNGKFIDDGKSVLSWFFKIFGIGILTILVALIFPKYQNESIRSKQEKDDFNFLLQVFIPKKGFFVTPILIDFNILVFIFISFLGVNPFYPRTEDLVKFGALTNDVANGEIWRFISAMFLHGGLMHLLMNMIVLGFIGFFAESSLGRVKFLIIYFVTGILAGISSLLWHQNLVGVGASGAIFGLIGAVAMAIFLSNKLKESKTILLLIFGYVIFNLLMGFVTNSDNVAHISGFLIGAFLGIIFYYTEP